MSSENTEKQAFRGFPDFRMRTRDAALNELSRPCSRFLSPLSTDERIKLFLTEKFATFDILDNVTYVTAPGVPLNWQALVHYLFKKELLEVPYFEFLPIRNDLPKAWNLQLRARFEPSKTVGNQTYVQGFSCSLSLETALSKAVGETLERYFLTRYTRRSCTQATYDQIRRKGRNALNPRVLNTFTVAQADHNHRLRYSDDSYVSWIQGSTVEGSPVMLPAQHVFWNYNFMHDDREPILVQPTTSGAGAYFTRTGAILSGLLENIQRDGFLIHWLNRMSPRRIDVQDVRNDSLTEILSRFDRYGIEAHFLNTTSDIAVPSVTCALIDTRTDVPVIGIGAGTGFTIEDTLTGSALEALSVLHHTMGLPDFELSDKFGPFSDPRIGQSERRALWRGQKMLDEFSFFLSGPMQSGKDFEEHLPSLHTEDEMLAYVMSELRSKGEGYEVNLYEVQDDVLTTLGFHVIRTIVPALFPLYLQEQLPTLDSRRLREVPEKLGAKASSQYNPLPHPFP